MDKNKFFEKVGKLTFSVILTSVLITWAVIAATTFTNWEILDATDLNNTFDLKVSKSDIPECWEWESLTYKGGVFSCFSPAASITPEWVQAGMEYNTSNSNKTVNVVFQKPFSWIPKIVVSAAGFYLSNDSRSETFDLWISYSNVTKTWFKLILPWNSPKHYNMRIKSASWIAIPPTGTWSSVSSSSYTYGCWNKRTTNNEKNWSCLIWLTNTYYSWESTCTYTVSGWSRWESEPIEFDWYKYSTKKMQTCN